MSQGGREGGREGGRRAVYAFSVDGYCISFNGEHLNQSIYKMSRNRTTISFDLSTSSIVPVELSYSRDIEI